MFGTSGIRGLYGSEIDEKLAIIVSNIFADCDVAVGRDIRKTGLPLAHAVFSGITSAGSDAIDLGIVPTPTVAFAAKTRGIKGMMITASHNPPEYNGLKFISNGMEIGKSDERAVEAKYKKKEVRLASWDGTGRLITDNSFIAKHKESVKSLVSIPKNKKPKIVIDSNGSGAVITPSLFRELGCDVISINDSLEAFSRPSEPNAKNLEGLSKKIVETKADFGIAHDGDADRCVIIDEKGEMIPFDVQLSMMIEHELAKSKNRKIVSTTESSLLIRETVESNGGELIVTPVGSVYVGETLERDVAVFGGEPCGEYIYQQGVHLPDAILAAAKFLEIYLEKGKFSELKKRYKTYPIHRDKFPAKNKRESMEKIKSQIKTEGKVNDEDGIRVDEQDGWFLIRASGTEPIVRLTMEYKDKEKLERKKKELIEIIRKSI
ncbi:phosphoglucosamine mutase [Candidatus Micrarchaeota archaeon]|nr:phosphoglucosamine mutase [Candidatus Micrarchaeota archaeon]